MECSSPQMKCGLQSQMRYHHHWVWLGTTLLGGSKCVIKFFIVCHTNILARNCDLDWALVLF